MKTIYNQTKQRDVMNNKYKCDYCNQSFKEYETYMYNHNCDMAIRQKIHKELHDLAGLVDPFNSRAKFNHIPMHERIELERMIAIASLNLRKRWVWNN